MTRWRGSAINQIKNMRELEKALMARNDMRLALNRYVASFNLQGQINRGTITEQQAIQLFKKAINDFSVRISYEITKRLNDAKYELKQEDLNNPLNMQQALNNPNSYASQLMNDTAAAIIAACEEEEIQNQQTAAFQQINIEIEAEKEKNESRSQSDLMTPTPAPEYSTENKEKLLTESVLGLAAGKEILDDVIEKYFGKEFKKEIHMPKAVEEEEEKFESPFKKMFKLEPPKPEDEK